MNFHDICIANDSRPLMLENIQHNDKNERANCQYLFNMMLNLIHLENKILNVLYLSFLIQKVRKELLKNKIKEFISKQNRRN